MSDNLATFTGSTQYAYIDATPWHGTGVNVLKQMQGAAPSSWVDVALDAAGMRYQVGSMPMYLADGTQIKGHKASVRFNPDGTVAHVFGPVGEGYTHTQNERNCDILRVLAERFGCVPASAGVLGDGERCFMLMRLADATVSPLPGDDVRGYFLLTWGHDGNLAVQGLGTTVRVVCQNTLALALAGRKAWFTVRHTASADARIDEAARIVERVMQAMHKAGDTFATMAHKNMSAADVRAYIERVIPNTSTSDTVAPVIVARRATIEQLVTSGKGADLANSAVPNVSLWAAVNAVSEYFDHVRPAEAQSAAGLLNAQTSALFGGNADIKAQALLQAQALLAA